MTGQIPQAGFKGGTQASPPVRKYFNLSCEIGQACAGLCGGAPSECPTSARTLLTNTCSGTRIRNISGEGYISIRVNASRGHMSPSPNPPTRWTPALTITIGFVWPPARSARPGTAGAPALTVTIGMAPAPPPQLTSAAQGNEHTRSVSELWRDYQTERLREAEALDDRYAELLARERALVAQFNCALDDTARDALQEQIDIARREMTQIMVRFDPVDEWGE